MKNQLLTAILFLATAMFLDSCNADKLPAVSAGPASGPEYGEVAFDISVPDIATKASDVSSHGNEAKVSDVQLLVFDASGRLASYANTGNALTSTVQLKTGRYSCRAVVNGPDLSHVGTLEAYEAVPAGLAAYNDPAIDFVMCGGNDGIEVIKNGSATCRITVSRLVCRVKLAGVENGCPAALGSLILKAAFLSNVVGNQTLSGSQAPSVFTNMYGRADVSAGGSIINGTSYPAVPAALTYADLGSTPLGHGVSLTVADWFYSYPNAYADVVKAWQPSWVPTASRLILVAGLGGRDYYYPVPVPQTARNTTYDVRVKITGEGLDDPQGDPSELSDKGSLSVSVTVTDWSAGTEYVVEY